MNEIQKKKFRCNKKGIEWKPNEVFFTPFVAFPILVNCPVYIGVRYDSNHVLLFSYNLLGCSFSIAFILSTSS